MRILPRYILKEFLVPLFYCLVGFISIYVLFELFGSFSRMLDANLPLSLALVYLGGYLAPYFHYLAPAALMLATLYTMWSMCRHSEIVAMRASGISFFAIVRPLLSIALLLALGVLFVSEWYVPRYAQWASQMKSEKFDLRKVAKADNVVLRNSDEGHTWNVDALLKEDGSSLKNVHVTINRPNGGARQESITSERADYLDGEWWFVKPRIQHYDANGAEIATRTPEADALSLRCYAAFGERPSDFIMQNRPWKFNSIGDRFRYLRTHPELTKEKRNELLYDTWEQIMAPWACIIITLFAIPAGIASGRQSVFKGILGALGLYFAFYGVTIGMMIVAKSQLCPAIPAAILPSVLFLVLGIRAFLKQR